MPNLDMIFRTTFLLGLFAGLTACGTASQAVRDVPVEGKPLTADISGLVRDESRAPKLVYVRPGRPGLGAYDRFIIDPVRVDYSDPEMQELRPEDIARMQAYFREAMIRELRAAGYRVATRSAADTMRISSTISGLTALSEAPNVVSPEALVPVNVGEVTAEGVFRDSLTNRIDAVVVAHAPGSPEVFPTPWSTWVEAERTFDRWAGELRQAIDAAHGR